MGAEPLRNFCYWHEGCFFIIFFPQRSYLHFPPGGRLNERFVSLMNTWVLLKKRLDVPIDYPLYIIFLRYNKDIHMYCINQYNNDYLAQSLSYFFCQEYVDYNTSIPIDLCNVFYFRNILNEAYHLLSIYLKLIRKYS